MPGGNGSETTVADAALSVALEREHQQVDAAIGAFLDELAGGTVDADGLNTALSALRRHIYLEEELLFPPLRSGARMMSIFGMVRGHGEIWRTMDTLADACAQGDRATLAEAGRQLLTLLEAHNKVEEPVIYPGADDDLTPEQTARLADFLRAGVLPDGWVCEKVR